MTSMDLQSLATRTEPRLPIAFGIERHVRHRRPCITRARSTSDRALPASTACSLRSSSHVAPLFMRQLPGSRSACFPGW